MQSENWKCDANWIAVTTFKTVSDKYFKAENHRNHYFVATKNNCFLFWKTRAVSMQAHGALFSGFLFSICMTFCDIKNIYIYHLSHVSLLPLSEPLRYLGFFIYFIYFSCKLLWWWAHISLTSCKGRWFKARRFLIFIEQHLRAQ